MQRKTLWGKKIIEAIVVGDTRRSPPTGSRTFGGTKLRPARRASGRTPPCLTC
jgi:hypothetical protein